MAKKYITGAELKAFYNDDKFWLKSDDPPADDGAWHEDVILSVNDEEQTEDFSIQQDLQDDDRVLILDGVVLFCDPETEGCTFETFFRRWRKKQSTVYLSVSVPRDKLDAVREAIKAAGGTVSA